MNNNIIDGGKIDAHDAIVQPSSARELLVNGPINAFRLEGKIDNVNKIVYLFGDYHNEIWNETKCDSYKSDDFINYFYKTMEKTDVNTKYDLIFENYASVDMLEEYKFSASSYRKNYIDELRYFVDSDMNISEEKKNNKTQLKNEGSRVFSNLRLHYLDIRSFLNYGKYHDLMNTIKNILFNKYTLEANIQLIISVFSVKNYIKLTINRLYKISKNKRKKNVDKVINLIKDKDILDVIKKNSEDISKSQNRIDKYLKKIFGKKTKNISKLLTNSSGYKHIFAKTKRIIILLNRCLRKSIALYELNRNIAENILTEQKSNRDEYFGNFIYNTDFIYITKIFNYILENIYLADECVVMIYVLITDLYCLYRLLSKNYINHVIMLEHWFMILIL